MSAKVGGCYYHEGKLAVATCAECGVGICRDCAVKDDRGRIICYQCGNKELKQQHREYKKELKEQGGRFRNGREFVIPTIIGILIVVVAGFLGGLTDSFKAENIIDISTIIVAYMLFSIPFGVIWLNDRFTPKYDTLYNRFGKWYFKICLGVLFGWIFFTIYWIRFIMTKTKSKKEQKS